jgi:hypothetical protein
MGNRPLRIALAILVALGAFVLVRALKPGTSGLRSESPDASQSPAPAVAPAASAGSDASTGQPSAATGAGDDAARAALQLKTLDEVLVSGNDNDPRIDTELKVLGEAAKQAFRDKYRQLPAEDRNARGTVVFLLGRNLTQPRDYQFLADVLSEHPCLSPGDCAKPMSAQGSGNPLDDHESGTAIALAYPQLTAIKALEHAPKSGLPEIREAVAKAMAAAKSSPTELAADYARRLGL